MIENNQHKTLYHGILNDEQYSFVKTIQANPTYFFEEYWERTHAPMYECEAYTATLFGTFAIQIFNLQDWKNFADLALEGSYEDNTESICFNLMDFYKQAFRMMSDVWD